MVLSRALVEAADVSKIYGETNRERANARARGFDFGSRHYLAGAAQRRRGVRIDGAFDGEIAVRGIVVIGEQGRVTCEQIRANTVVISGSLKGNITAHRVEITTTGRVWGDVVTIAFSTEEGAFLRGKIRMEEKLDLGFAPELPADENLEQEAAQQDGEEAE